MANTVTSRTSPCAAGVVTHRMKQHTYGAVILMKYTKGDTSYVTVVPTWIYPNISATDEYQPLLMGSNAPSVKEWVFSASGNYQIPLAAADDAGTLKVTVTFPDGTTGDVVLDVRTN